MSGKAAPIAYVPLSAVMAQMLTQTWSEPVQMRVVVGKDGAELVYRSVSWKKLEPQPGTVQ